MTLDEIIRMVVSEKGHQKVARDARAYKAKFHQHINTLDIRWYIVELERKTNKRRSGKNLYDGSDCEIIKFLCEKNCSKVKKMDFYTRLQNFGRVTAFMEVLGYRVRNMLSKVYVEEEVEKWDSYLYDALNQVRKNIWMAYNDEEVPESFWLLEECIRISRNILDDILELSYIPKEFGEQEREAIFKTLDTAETVLHTSMPTIRRSYKTGWIYVQRKFEDYYWKCDYKIKLELRMEIYALCDQVNTSVKEFLMSEKTYYEICIEEWKKNLEYYLCAYHNRGQRKKQFGYALLTEDKSRYRQALDQMTTSNKTADALLKMLFLKYFLSNGVYNINFRKKDHKKSTYKLEKWIRESLYAEVQKVEKAFVKAVVEQCKVERLKGLFDENFESLKMELSPGFYIDMKAVMKAGQNKRKNSMVF